MKYARSKRVLVSGGAGFIGAHTALELVKKGYSVRVLDNLSPQIHGADPLGSYTVSLIRDEVELLPGDVRDVGAWERAVEGQDAVIHLAAETGTGQSMYEVGRYADVNVQGTAHLLDVLVNRKHDVQKVIVASSRAIYGEGKYSCKTHGHVYPHARQGRDMAAGDFEVKCPACRMDAESVPTDEEAALSPASVYAITKLTQEQLVLSVCRSVGIKAMALRYQNVYGPGQSLRNPYTGILSIFSTALYSGESINIFEDGKESRDFVYIDDVAEANVAALERDTADGMAVNVGTGVPTTVVTVAQALSESYGLPRQVHISGNYRSGDIRHNVADLGRCAAVLGFTPRWSFADGIEEFTRWVQREIKSSQESRTSYRSSLEEMRAKGLLN